MASKANLTIDQGSTFSTDLRLTDENGDPIDLTGYSVRSKMRRWYTSTNSVTFTATLNVAAGTVNLYLDANTTANCAPYRYVYDVEIFNANNVVSRVVEGVVTVNPEATK